VFYEYPPNGIKSSKGKWLRGVDVKSGGGYVILPEGEWQQDHTERVPD
jgi:hypothetical protein